MCFIVHTFIYIFGLKKKTYKHGSSEVSQLIFTQPGSNRLIKSPPKLNTLVLKLFFRNLCLNVSFTKLPKFIINLIIIIITSVGT